MNCLTFALQHFKYGHSDHLIVRKSHWGWFPHFKVMYELTDGSIVIKEYVPVQPCKHLIPPIFFKGQVLTTIYKKVEQYGN